MSDHGAKFDDSFKVKKACDNGSVIEKFKHNSQVQTPKKVFICFLFENCFGLLVMSYIFLFPVAYRCVCF